MKDPDLDAIVEQALQAEREQDWDAVDRALAEIEAATNRAHPLAGFAAPPWSLPLFLAILAWRVFLWFGR